MDRTDTTPKRNILREAPIIKRFSRVSALLLLTSVTLLSILTDVWGENKISRVHIRGTGATYKTRDTVQIRVDCQLGVHVTGTPQIKFTTRDDTEGYYATYSSNNPKSEILFTYTVAAGVTAPNGIAIPADAIDVTKGTITTDSSRKTFSLTHSALPTNPLHKIDGVAPTINGSPSITSTARSNNTYVAGEAIQVSVTFSETVKVTGTPQIALTIGDNTRQALYDGGESTSTKLVFQYTVVASDEDTDGIAIAADALALNSGTITDVPGTAATLTHTALTAQASHKVDTTAPTINTISITSSAANSNTYTPTETIRVSVTFSETVAVTGIPQLALDIGGTTRQALYTGGTGTATLVFQYTIIDGDNDADGISIPANPIALVTSSIKDIPGNDATLTHWGVAAAATHKVDALKPTVRSISIVSQAGSDGTYITGDVVQVSVVFSEVVVVRGTPQLGITIGDNTRQVNYGSTGGTNTLVFAYTIASNDADTDGISIEANALQALNGATIKDNVGNDAVLNHSAVATAFAHKVDGVKPTVSSISIASTADNNGTYILGEDIAVSVVFNEAVAVTTDAGTPQIGVTIGSTPRQAIYETSTGTDTLVFEYTVVAGNNLTRDEDIDGISIAADALQASAGSSITWQTESELDNAGFNVFRSETKNGTFTKVNPRLIIGAGTTSERNTYQFIDTGTKPRNHYYYRLEEVSFAGVHQTLTTQRLKRNISPIGQQLTTLGALKKPTP